MTTSQQRTSEAPALKPRTEADEATIVVLRNWIKERPTGNPINPKTGKAFPNFMAEYWASTIKLSNGHTRRWKDDPDIIFEAKDEGGYIELQYIENTGQRGVGKGSRALDWFCDMATRHGRIVQLFAWRTGDGNHRLETCELKKWYARRGFERSEYGALTLIRFQRSPS